MKKIRQGFTLIELMIVLAIAGLIISLVFVAASAAQRNGRDTTRRADAQKLATAIEQWSANNNGALPDGQSDLDKLFSENYLDANKFKDPKSGATYLLRQSTSAPTSFFWEGILFYVYNPSVSPGQYFITTKLESGAHTYRP